jgi:DNA-binding NtrC family response regulator
MLIPPTESEADRHPRKPTFMGSRMEIASKSSVVLSFDGNAPQPLPIRARALVFSDPASRELLRYIERLAPSDAPVLINGETGTGKELVARHIHQLSGRKGPFLAVNCGAITENLAESELFGHEAGAFTGAAGRREGWFESARGGTLFLDEIGDLPLSLQVKLLRVVQEREVVRVGSRRPIPIDVRLITATHVDLDRAVAAGRFRSDLHYRLNIAQLRLPPLRERRTEILPLAGHFIGLYAQRMHAEAPILSREAERILLEYAWPGNIRELENVIHFALLIAPDGEIRPEHLKIAPVTAALPMERADGRAAVPGVGFPSDGQDDASGASAADDDSVGPGEAVPQATMDGDLGRLAGEVRSLFGRPVPRLFDRIEGLIVQEAFHHAGRNQVHAAALLGVTRNVMRTLLKRYGFIAAVRRERGAGPLGEAGALDEAGPLSQALARELDEDSLAPEWRGADMDVSLFLS